MQIQVLRNVVMQVKTSHPFITHACVVLPEHLHFLIELPEGDADFKTRWMLIKMLFSKAIPNTEYLSKIRKQRCKRGIWHRRYWKHLIKDEADFAAHVDYVHINPVKHGLIKNVVDLPCPTFDRLVKADVYPRDWAGNAGSVLDVYMMKIDFN